MQMKKIPVNISYDVSDKYGFRVSIFFKEEDFLLNKRKILDDIVTLAVDFCGRIDFLSPRRTSLFGEIGYFIHIEFTGISSKSNLVAINYFIKCLLLEDYVLFDKGTN